MIQKIKDRVSSGEVKTLAWPIVVVLWTASKFYRLGQAFSNPQKSAPVKVPVPVISVGNLTVGGSGKTPMVIELARFFEKRGRKVGIVSSGYGRKNNVDICGTGIHIRKRSLEDVGDEVMMMAHVLPEVHFAVSRKKSAAAELISRQAKVDLVIVDDGFQHRRLERDFNLLLIDAGIDLRKEGLLPLGRMREPIEAMERADGMVLTKVNLAENNHDFRDWLGSRYGEKILAEVEFHNDEIICSSEHFDMESIGKKSVYFFAGIASLEPLLRYVKMKLPNISGSRRFADHYRYRLDDVVRIKADLDRLNPDYAITTHKDYVKLRYFDFGRAIYYLNLRLQYRSGEKAFFDRLLRAVEG